MVKKQRIVCAAAIMTIAAAACSSPPAPASLQSPSAGPAVTATVDRLDNQTFCAGARQAGIANMQLIGNAGDSATLLAAFDRLVPAAPPEIRDDFATFDKLEHGILDPDHPDPSAMQGIDPSTGRDALARVDSYLKNTCHIG